MIRIVRILWVIFGVCGTLAIFFGYMAIWSNPGRVQEQLTHTACLTGALALVSFLGICFILDVLDNRGGDDDSTD